MNDVLAGHWRYWRMNLSLIQSDPKKYKSTIHYKSYCTDRLKIDPIHSLWYYSKIENRSEPLQIDPIHDKSIRTITNRKSVRTATNQSEILHVPPSHAHSYQSQSALVSAAAAAILLSTPTTIHRRRTPTPIRRCSSRKGTVYPMQLYRS
jgi:hypothetical protein